MARTKCQRNKNRENRGGGRKNCLQKKNWSPSRGEGEKNGGVVWKSARLEIEEEDRGNEGNGPTLKKGKSSLPNKRERSRKHHKTHLEKNSRLNLKQKKGKRGNQDPPDHTWGREERTVDSKPCLYIGGKAIKASKKGFKRANALGKIEGKRKKQAKQIRRTRRQKKMKVTRLDRHGGERNKLGDQRKKKHTISKGTPVGQSRRMKKAISKRGPIITKSIPRLLKPQKKKSWIKNKTQETKKLGLVRGKKTFRRGERRLTKETKKTWGAE